MIHCLMLVIWKFFLKFHHWSRFLATILFWIFLMKSSIDLWFDKLHSIVRGTVNFATIVFSANYHSSIWSRISFQWSSTFCACWWWLSSRPLRHVCSVRASFVRSLSRRLKILTTSWDCPCVFSTHGGGSFRRWSWWWRRFRFLRWQWRWWR